MASHATRPPRGRLRMFENKVLKRISGPTAEVVSGGRKKLHIEELPIFLLFTIFY
jgi:hypothetical protein